MLLYFFNFCRMSSSRSKDPFWEYGTQVAPGDSNRIKCNYCLNVYNGGISRFKQHLGWIKGNVAACTKVPEDVKEKAQKTISSLQASKKAKADRLKASLDEVVVGSHNVEDNSSHRSFFSGIQGTLDPYVRVSAEEVNSTKGKEIQSTLESSKLKKKERDDAIQYACEWTYEKGIPFHACEGLSFDKFLHAVGLHGPYMKPPTPYEFRTKCLNVAVERTKAELQSFAQTCKLDGCSLMTDAWTDRKGRSLMNIVVHSTAGTAFWMSKNVSSEVHDGKFIFEFVDEAIGSEDGPGEDNVVQVVTDNASNNMLAAKMLEVKRPKIFWTCCAAHTINLLLADIGKLKQVKDAVTMARQTTVFIYGHTKSLDMMRVACKDLDSQDIVRPGVTRFATAFLSLHSMLLKKKELREMFRSEEWDALKLSKTRGAIEVKI